MSVVIILILIGATVAFFMPRSGETLRFETSAAPHNVIMTAVGLVGTKRRWHAVSQSEHGASFQYRKGPNVLVALILLLCFIVPGILYVVLAGKRESLVANVGTDGRDKAIVQVASNGYRRKAAGRTAAKGWRGPDGDRRGEGVSADAIGRDQSASADAAPRPRLSMHCDRTSQRKE